VSKSKDAALSPLLEHSDGGILQGMIERFRTASRRRRSALFLSAFALTPHTRILDLGGWDGTHIHALLDSTAVRPENVYVADIDHVAVQRAAREFGYQPVYLREGGKLDFADKHFDIVFCSSVLEHVTIPKEQIWLERSGRRFRQRALLEQNRFSRELRRVASGYFVQVPNRWFPIETHSWLPFLAYLPRRLQCHIINISNRIWIKKTDPDFHLPSAAEMREFFPRAELLRERVCGLTKSLIAVRRA
jgi:2-polyprenyl-3-methyl-5-hydroxy-6-metoxy-1,4-benzoquinol methylase